MDKKELKWYVAPELELLETETEGFLCVSKDGDFEKTDDDGDDEVL